MSAQPVSQRLWWRVFGVWFCFVVVALLVQVLGAWVYTGPLGLTRAASWIYGASKVAMIGLPVLVLWLGWRGADWLKRSSWTVREVLVGVLLGGLVGGILYGFFSLTEIRSLLDAQEVARRFSAFGIDTLSAFVVFSILFSLIHSAFEEWYWRWFVHGLLRERLSFWPSAALGSLAFGAHHVLVLSLVMSYAWAMLLGFLVALMGVVWCVLCERRQSLLAAWVSHAMVDAAILALVMVLLARGS